MYPRPPRVGGRLAHRAVERRTLLRALPAIAIAATLGGVQWRSQENTALEEAGRAELSITLEPHSPEFTGAPAPEARVYLVPLGPAPDQLGERIDCGATEDGALVTRADPGLYRVLVVDGRGGFAELDRDLVAAGRHRERVRLRAVAEVNAGMSLVPSGAVRVAIGGGGRADLAHERRHGDAWVDRQAVSNGEYEAFLDASGHPEPVRWKGDLPADWGPEELERWRALPVTSVSWEDARAYAEWAGKRLPSLAEWVQAMAGPAAGDAEWLAAETARGLERSFSLGKGLRDELGRDRSASFRAYLAHAEPVQQGPPAGFGPHGMHHPVGNVHEWVGSVPWERGEDGSWRPDLDLRYVLGTAWHSSPGRVAREGLAGPTSVPWWMATADQGFRCAKSATP